MGEGCKIAQTGARGWLDNFGWAGVLWLCWGGQTGGPGFHLMLSLS